MSSASKDNPIDGRWTMPVDHGDAAGAVGGARRIFEAMLPDVDVYVPDTIIDTGTVSGLRYRIISSRGLAKRVTPSPRQDQVAVTRLPGGGVGFALADGVSEAAMSHVGASLVVRYGLKALARPVSWPERVDLVNWALVEEHARAEGIDSSEIEVLSVRENLAATMVLALLEPADTGWALDVALVGDSALLLCDGDGLDEPLPPPDHGAANVTDALPGPSDAVRHVRRDLEPGTVILLASDGISRPLLVHPDPVRLFRHPPPQLEVALWLDDLRDPLGDDQTLMAIWIPARGEAPDA